MHPRRGGAPFRGPGDARSVCENPAHSHQGETTKVGKCGPGLRNPEWVPFCAWTCCSVPKIGTGMRTVGLQVRLNMETHKISTIINSTVEGTQRLLLFLSQKEYLINYSYHDLMNPSFKWFILSKTRIRKSPVPDMNSMVLIYRKSPCCFNCDPLRQNTDSSAREIKAAYHPSSKTGLGKSWLILSLTHTHGRNFSWRRVCPSPPHHSSLPLFLSPPF